MLPRVILFLISLAFSQTQNINPLEKETQNVGRKHDATAPKVEAVKPEEKPQESSQEPRKVYSPPERRNLSLTITRAKSILEERKSQEQAQVKSSEVKPSEPVSQSKAPELKPIKGVCVLQSELRVRATRSFADMPCLVIYPENKIVKARAMFEPDDKTLTLKGKIIAIDNEPEDIPLLRAGSENLPAEVRRFILANAFINSMSKTADQTAKVIQNASKAEVNVQIGNSSFRAGASFFDVMKKIPLISSVFAIGNFAQGLSAAIAPQGQIPPEFILPPETELYFSRP